MNFASTNIFRIRIDTHLVLDLPGDQEVLPLYHLMRTNLEHLRPWMDWADKVTLSNQEEVIRNWREKPPEKGFERIIYLDNEPVGACGIRILDSDCGELGYWIGQAHTGKGYITRIAQFLTDYGFLRYGLHRIEISCAKENVKSRAVPERLGYTHEASLRERHRLHGVYHDLEIYGMLRREWDELRE